MADGPNPDLLAGVSGARAPLSDGSDDSDGSEPAVSACAVADSAARRGLPQVTLWLRAMEQLSLVLSQQRTPLSGCRAKSFVRALEQARSSRAIGYLVVRLANGANVVALFEGRPVLIYSSNERDHLVTFCQRQGQSIPSALVTLPQRDFILRLLSEGIYDPEGLLSLLWSHAEYLFAELFCYYDCPAEFYAVESVPHPTQDGTQTLPSSWLELMRAGLWRNRKISVASLKERLQSLLNDSKPTFLPPDAERAVELTVAEAAMVRRLEHGASPSELILASEQYGEKGQLSALQALTVLCELGIVSTGTPAAGSERPARATATQGAKPEEIYEGNQAEVEVEAEAEAEAEADEAKPVEGAAVERQKEQTARVDKQEQGRQPPDGKQSDGKQRHGAGPASKVFPWVILLTVPIGLFVCSVIMMKGAREYANIPYDSFFIMRRITLLVAGLLGLALTLGVTFLQAFSHIGWITRSRSSLAVALVWGLIVGFISPLYSVSGSTRSIAALAITICFNVLAEQVFFRGFATRLFIDRIVNLKVSVLLSGAYYGFYQLSNYSMWPETSPQFRLFWCLTTAVVVGVPDSYLCARTQSILPPIVRHAASSIVVLVLSVLR